MSWAKLDDRYDDGRKIRQAWHAHPRAVGLHAMAITYCARNETNGRIDDLWLVEKLPVKRDRDVVLQALVEIGLFDRIDGGYEVHDYLDYNDSREVLAERRRRDAERKGRKPPPGTRPDRPTESDRSPNGIRAEAERNPDASRAGGSAPAGPRPDPTETTTPQERVATPTSYGPLGVVRSSERMVS